jgi:hypothetical protein
MPVIAEGSFKGNAFGMAGAMDMGTKASIRTTPKHSICNNPQCWIASE